MKIKPNRLQPKAHERLLVLRSKLTQPDYAIAHNIKLLRMAVGWMDTHLTRAGRLSFLHWVFRNPDLQSSNDLNIGEAKAIVSWADPRKIGDEWTYADEFYLDLRIIADALGAEPSPEPVLCRMCIEGKVERIPTMFREENELAVCQCCKGNYEDCPTCRELGAV